jgi:hypothetical protein
MKKKLDAFRRRCATRCRRWVPIFDEEYPAIDSAKCCLAPWKKCAEGVILETDEAALRSAGIVVAVAMATEEVATAIVETDEARAIMVEAMTDLVTVVTDQAPATVEDVQVAVLPSRRPA